MPLPSPNLPSAPVEYQASSSPLGTPVARHLRWIGAVAVGLLLILSFGLHELSVIADSVRTIHRDRLLPLTQLKQVSDGYAIRVIDLVNKANAGRLSKASAIAELKALRPQIEQNWQSYLGTELTEREHRLIAEAALLKQRADAAIAQLQQALLAMEPPLTGQLIQFDGPLYERIDPLTGVLASLSRLQRDVATLQHDEALARSDALQTVLAWSAAVTMLTLVVVLAIVSMQLWQRRRLRELAESERQLAEYNQALQHQVAIRTSELQQVMGELDAVQLAVRDELQAPAADVHHALDALRTQLDQHPNAHWLALVERATQAVDRMNLVLADLLALSRLEQEQLQPQELSLSVLLEEVLHQYPQAVRERMRLTLQPLPTVYGDRGLLAQMLHMLLEQAIANTDALSVPQLTVCTHRSALGLLAVEFCDNGIASAEVDAQDSRSQPDHAQRNPSPQNERSIRLAVCSKIAHLHGGRVWLEPRAGQGSCVYFSLPDMQINLHAA